jgi:hypothetical protein
MKDKRSKFRRSRFSGIVMMNGGYPGEKFTGEYLETLTAIVGAQMQTVEDLFA